MYLTFFISKFRKLSLIVSWGYIEPLPSPLSPSDPPRAGSQGHGEGHKPQGQHHTYPGPTLSQRECLIEPSRSVSTPAGPRKQRCPVTGVTV